MACKTASVERVADKTSKAKEQIDKLEKIIRDQSAALKAEFSKKITENLALAQITDGRGGPIEENIKTEYTSEFSLDKIAGVVTSSLKALQVATDPSKPQPQTSPEAIEAYTEVVNTIAEAAKSSSKAAGSLAFSMTRLAPGILAFLYASSTNIQDDETFGKEAITTTAIYHTIIKSIRDLELEGAFDAAKERVAINLKSYKTFITLQAALVDQLAEGKIDIETYDKKDSEYGIRIAAILKRIDSESDNKPVSGMAANFIVSNKEMLIGKDNGSPNLNHEIALEAIGKLSTMGREYTTVIERTKARIANGYF